VLTNLLSNAIKFSPKGSTVAVRAAAAAGGQLRFTVTDQGPGLSVEKRALLFRRFQQIQGAPARRPKGSGLGLAISKAIVERHGGEIGVESDGSNGSAFWFEIPLYQPLAEAA